MQLHLIVLSALFCFSSALPNPAISDAIQRDATAPLQSREVGFPMAERQVGPPQIEEALSQSSNAIFKRDNQKKLILAVLKGKSVTYNVGNVFFTIFRTVTNKWAVKIVNQLTVKINAYLTDDSQLGLDLVAKLLEPGAKGTAVDVPLTIADDIIISWKEAN